MPYQQTPSMNTVQGKKNTFKKSASFSFQWIGETVQAINLLGVNVGNGSMFDFTTQQIQNTTSFGQVKSLMLTYQFIPAHSAAPYGPLFVFMPDTQQLIELGVPSSGTYLTTSNSICISAMFPISSNAPSRIRFIKMVDPNSILVTPTGSLFATVFNYHNPPFYSVCGG